MPRGKAAWNWAASLHRARLAVEGNTRAEYRQADAPLGRIGRLAARRLHLGPRHVAKVTEVFVRLYEDGLIYRGKRLVNWDPVLKTALSDLEVVAEEETGTLWHLRYPLSEGPGYLVVATTRPETMLGDAAVAVHPDDERYRHLVGRAVRLPLTSRELPVIADAMSIRLSAAAA